MQILHFHWNREGEINLKLCSEYWVLDLTAEKAYGHAFFTQSLMPNYLLVNKFTTKFNGQQLDWGSTDRA